MIRLKENDRKGTTASLTPAQADYLRRCGLVDVRPKGREFVVLPKAKRVGAVHAHGLDVVVTPKVSIPRLLFLIGYARNPGFRPEDVEGVEADGLWSIVAESLCRTVERALSRGVVRGFTAEDTTSTVVRGRIRVGDQVTRRPGRLLPVEITHDEFTVDTPENRLLRAAVSRMLTVPRVDGAIQVRLRHLLNRLTGVSPLAHGAPPPRRHLHRLNERYHDALRIADLVLRTMSFEVGSDGLSVAAFVVNMEDVFEDFVTTALTEAWHSRSGRTERQYRTKLDHESTIPMKVDVVHFVDDRPRFVVDAKYKLEDDSPNTDLYQVFAYSTALRVDRAWLVFADETASVTHHNVLNSSVTITKYALNLDASPEDILAQVADLARSAWT
ncbi:MAG: restriction endonuclease [Saccharothrix sp.]|nr:restriction endonuclease [Saccharothrix sp.]